MVADRRSAAEPGAEQPEPGQRYRHRPGSRVARTQLIGLIVITVLCGSATAVVGPIAFIGLMMPHMARWLVGADHRWSLPVTPARHPGPAAVCRRDWPPAGARRTAGIGGVRLSRRAGADLAGAPPAAGRWPVIAPSRRLIASCLLLMAASLLISLLAGARPGALTIDQVFSALFGDAPRNVAMVVNERRCRGC